MIIVVKCILGNADAFSKWEGNADADPRCNWSLLELVV